MAAEPEFHVVFTEAKWKALLTALQAAMHPTIIYSLDGDLHRAAAQKSMTQAGVALTILADVTQGYTANESVHTALKNKL